MCGILGVVEPRRPVEAAQFQRMLDTLAMRGPDGSGVQMLDAGRVALGHRRLAIIDLSDAGAQPMSNEDGRIWGVTNGEIYNHAELRRVLESRGHAFRSACDSEVVLHAYEEWGTACVERLRGIFAFGIWDVDRRRLLLARDRLGVKPLYYTEREGRLAFASQPRALLADPRCSREVDVAAFSDYLAYGYVPYDRAIFRGMHKLPAAHRLIFEGGRATLERYWTLETQIAIRDPREAEEVVAAQVEESVSAEMVSDVPVGLFLSGGVDSTVVGAVASEHSREALRAYTIGVEEPGQDERPFARVAAEACGAQAFEAPLDPAVVRELIGPVVEVYDEPFYTGSAFPTLRVSQLARQHGTKVVLTGDGGDELFAGYHHYDSHRRVLAIPAWRRNVRRARGVAKAGMDAWRSPDPLAEYFGHLDIGVLGWRWQRRLLPRAVRSELDGDVLAPLRRFHREALPAVTAARYVDLHTYLCDHILCKVDRASMACGVEARVPLLDHRLVELAFSIADDVVYAEGERKALFKRALADRIPPELISMRKKGFGIPVDSWVDAQLPDGGRRFVRDGVLVARGLLDAPGVARLFDSGRNRGWLLVAGELWARRWLEGRPIDEVIGDLLR